MVRFLPALLALCVAGCAPRTVKLEVAPSPAVALEVRTVAVVAQDRECKPIADAIIAQLDRRASITVDPRSDVRLQVFGCGLDIGWTLREEVDATGARTQTIRRADLTGRGHAVLAVRTPEGTLAHLVGGSRDGKVGAWGVDDMFRTRRAMRQSLTVGVAGDLVDQLSPIPQQLARRIYPRANHGSARDLHTQAVLAEQRGDLESAMRLARAALEQRPTERTAAYVRALERRVASPSTNATDSL